MSGIKKLAGQTVWYGFSNIFGRFLNYLLNPLLAQIFASEKFGIISTLFAVAAFLNIVYTWGLETTYFRFSNSVPERKVYNNTLSLLIITTIFLSVILIAFNNSIATSLLQLPDHPEYVTWVILVVAFDTLCVLPLAKLRHEGKPVKYALVRISSILLNIALILFFLVYCDRLYKAGSDSFWLRFYDPSIGVGYVIIANLIASGVSVLFLGTELLKFRFSLEKGFIRQIIVYTWPLVIVGFGGMINETIDRFMILHLYPGSTGEAYSESGIYSANYKLAVLIVLFIQAFRMGAEPFFFKQASGGNAPRTYARVMKFFVITCCFCFLGVVLFLDIWKYFMGTAHPEFYTGLKVVPLIMLAKICLGIYYNLSVWYKVTNRNLIGAWITLGGAAITIATNYLLIPHWGYMACGLATLLCYGFMVVASQYLGQRYYPVPYPWKKIIGYILLCVFLFGIHQLTKYYSASLWLTHVSGVVLIGGFALFVLRVERREFERIPYVNRIYKSA